MNKNKKETILIRQEEIRDVKMKSKKYNINRVFKIRCKIIYAKNKDMTEYILQRRAH